MELKLLLLGALLVQGVHTETSDGRTTSTATRPSESTTSPSSETREGCVAPSGPREFEEYGIPTASI
jgi:hypothetical protein